MSKSFYNEEELLIHIDYWCEKLEESSIDSEEYKNALTELNYHKSLLQQTLKKKAKKKFKLLKHKNK